MSTKEKDLPFGKSFSLVDTIRAYSNHAGLLEDLDHTLRQLAKALATPAIERTSVTSSGRVGRVHAVRDRLSHEDVIKLTADFQAGTPKWRLAERYGVSLSSVKRLLRATR